MVWWGKLFCFSAKNVFSVSILRHFSIRILISYFQSNYIHQNTLMINDAQLNTIKRFIDLLFYVSNFKMIELNNAIAFFFCKKKEHFPKSILVNFHKYTKIIISGTFFECIFKFVARWRPLKKPLTSLLFRC